MNDGMTDYTINRGCCGKEAVPAPSWLTGSDQKYRPDKLSNVQQKQKQQQNLLTLWTFQSSNLLKLM
jgi:hypothetical protein